MPDLRRFQNYQQAKDYLDNTKPIRGTQRIPWTYNRKRHDVYSLHEVTVFGGLKAVAGRMYSTDIVTYVEDGSVLLDYYDSRTTAEALNQTLPSGLRVSMRGGHKFVNNTPIPVGLTAPVKFWKSEIGWTTSPEECGYFVGPGRKWPTKRMGAFMNQVLKALELADKLSEGKARLATKGHCVSIMEYEDAVERLTEIMGDWQIGDPVDPGVYSDLLTPEDAEIVRFALPMKQRLEQWGKARMEPKEFLGNAPPPAWKLLDYTDYQQFLEKYNEFHSK